MGLNFDSQVYQGPGTVHGTSGTCKLVVCTEYDGTYGIVHMILYISTSGTQQCQHARNFSVDRIRNSRAV